MHTAYICRHAQDEAPRKGVRNQLVPLTVEGRNFAENVMGKIIRADLEQEWRNGGCKPLHINVFHGNLNRMRQTKDLMLRSFNDNMGQAVKVYNTDALNSRDTGVFYGLGAEEIARRFPRSAQLYGRMKDFEPERATPPGLSAKPVEYYIEAARKFMGDRIDKSFDTPEGQHHVDIYITSGTQCEEIRRYLAMQSEGDAKLFHGHHIEGSVYKFGGEPMILMQDQGFIVSGQKQSQAVSQPQHRR